MSVLGQKTILEYGNLFEKQYSDGEAYSIGLVRLIVGQKACDDSKVQYCITAIDVHP